MDQASIYVSVLALTASVVSLLFSFRNDSFNKKFKLYEARFEILSVISESMLLYTRCISAHRNLVAEAERSNNQSIAHVTSEMQNDVDALSPQLDDLFKTASEFKDNDVLSSYRDLLPELRRMRDRIMAMHEQIVSTHAKAAKLADLRAKA